MRPVIEPVMKLITHTAYNVLTTPFSIISDAYQAADFAARKASSFMKKKEYNPVSQYIAGGLAGLVGALSGAVAAVYDVVAFEASLLKNTVLNLIKSPIGILSDAVNSGDEWRDKSAAIIGGAFSSRGYHSKFANQAKVPLQVVAGVPSALAGAFVGAVLGTTGKVRINTGIDLNAYGNQNSSSVNNYVQKAAREKSQADTFTSGLRMPSVPKSWAASSASATAGACAVRGQQGRS